MVVGSGTRIDARAITMACSNEPARRVDRMTIPPTVNAAHRERHDYLGRGDQDELSLGRQRPDCKRHNCSTGACST
jgi:hypothetical protein